MEPHFLWFYVLDQTYHQWLNQWFYFQDYSNMDDFSLNLDNVTENMFDHFKVNLWQNVLFYKCTYFSFVQNTIMNRMDQYWQIGCVIHFGNCCQALVKVKKGGYIRYIVEIFITSKLVATIYRSLSLKLFILIHLLSLTLIRGKACWRWLLFQCTILNETWQFLYPHIAKLPPEVRFIL